MQQWGGLIGIAGCLLLFGSARRQTLRHATERLPWRSSLALPRESCPAAGCEVLFSVLLYLPGSALFRRSHVGSQGSVMLHRQDELANRGLEAGLRRLTKASQQWSFGDVLDRDPARLPGHEHFASGLKG